MSRSEIIKRINKIEDKKSLAMIEHAVEVAEWAQDKLYVEKYIFLLSQEEQRSFRQLSGMSPTDARHIIEMRM